MYFVPQRQTHDPEVPIDSEFGALVRATRKARAMSQWDLARATTPPTTQATISALESGKAGRSSSVVLSVCRVLGLAPPIVSGSPRLRRWVAVGQLLEAHHDVLFAYHLQMLEALASSLSTKTEAEIASGVTTDSSH